MNKQDTYITVGMVIVTAFISLLFIVPQPAPHIAAEEKPPSKEQQSYFATTTLQAKAAFVYDVTTKKILFSKNSAEPLPLASLTKIMTAVTAAELTPLSTVITIDEKSLAQSGDTGLYLFERWNLKSLLQFTLVSSSNDGAAAIASALGAPSTSTLSTPPNLVAFVGAMNLKAQSLGLTSMQFYNPTGLDENAVQAGAYGSAQDVGYLMAYALHHDEEIIAPTRYPVFKVSSLDNLQHTVLNTDVIAKTIPSLLAGKTGYTELAGGNLAIAFDAGIQHPVIIVVLGSTYDGRFEDVKILVDASIKAIVNNH
jgi:D-alanyl-D-alanine carboxypeptidase (penicillin-binding protein 5/6)